MKEELQTTNNELTTRTEEFSRVNTYLRSILSSLKIGMVVLDLDLHVRAWNTRAADFWGLRGDEVVGQPFFNLNIGLSVDALMPHILDVLNGKTGSSKVTLKAINRRGQTFNCQVSATPLREHGEEIQGVVLLMEAIPD